MTTQRELFNKVFECFNFVLKFHAKFVTSTKLGAEICHIFIHSLVTIVKVE